MSYKNIALCASCLAVENTKIERITNKKPKRKGEVGKVSAQYTTDAQWMFLFKLADKVYNHLTNSYEQFSYNQRGILTSRYVNNFLSWLKEKLVKNQDFEHGHLKTMKGSSRRRVSKGWQKFKSICTKALESENLLSGSDVKKTESRLCFMGSKKFSEDTPLKHQFFLGLAVQKGNLRNISHNKKQDSKVSSYSEDLAFKENSWNKSNWDLWSDFISDHGKDIKTKRNFKEFEVKFEEWYQEAYSLKKLNSSKSKKLSETLSVTVKLNSGYHRLTHISNSINRSKTKNRDHILVNVKQRTNINSEINKNNSMSRNQQKRNNSMHSTDFATNRSRI